MISIFTVKRWIGKLVFGPFRRINRAILKKKQIELFRSKSIQENRFYALKEEFRNQNHVYEKYDIKKFITPLWEGFIEKISSKLTDHLTMGFLQDETLKYTMFFSPSIRKIPKIELKFIKTQITSQHNLRRILEEDYVGLPQLSNLKYATSNNSIHHLYHILRFLNETNLDSNQIHTIIEWGGGYGNLAKIFIRLKNTSMTYIIIDLPFFTCLQWLYLSTVIGEDHVFLFQKPNDIVQEGKINLIPVCFIESVNIKADLFISTWGISESSKFAQDFVINTNFFKAPHILLCFQRKDENLPDAERVGKFVQSNGASVQEIEYLLGNFYAFK